MKGIHKEQWFQNKTGKSVIFEVQNSPIDTNLWFIGGHVSLLCIFCVWSESWLNLGLIYLPWSLLLDQGPQTHFILQATRSPLRFYMGWTRKTPISVGVKSLTTDLIKEIRQKSAIFNIISQFSYMVKKCCCCKWKKSVSMSLWASIVRRNV